MSTSKQVFYNTYHLKNDNFVKVISRPNFTYYYVLHFLDKALPKPAKKKVLDVGSGVGTLALYLGSKDAQVTGIDVSSRAIEIAENARKQLKLKNVSFQRGELKKGNGAYDLVICTEVVEHIKNDSNFVRLIHSHLKKGGRLLLTTPSQENLLYGLGFYNKFDREVGHLRRYTTESIQHLVESAGFKVEWLARKESILRNLLFTTKLGFLIRFIKGPLIPVFHVIDETLLPIFGATDLIVIAKKV